MEARALGLLLSLLAGMATSIGAAVVFFIRDLTPPPFAMCMAASAGVMAYVSLVELFSTAVEKYAEKHPQKGHAEGYATVAFFGGWCLLWLFDYMSHWLLAAAQHRDSRQPDLQDDEEGSAEHILSPEARSLHVDFAASAPKPFSLTPGARCHSVPPKRAFRNGSNLGQPVHASGCSCCAAWKYALTQQQQQQQRQEDPLLRESSSDFPHTTLGVTQIDNCRSSSSTSKGLRWTQQSRKCSAGNGANHIVQLQLSHREGKNPRVPPFRERRRSSADAGKASEDELLTEVPTGSYCEIGSQGTSPVLTASLGGSGIPAEMSVLDPTKKNWRETTTAIESVPQESFLRRLIKRRDTTESEKLEIEEANRKFERAHKGLLRVGVFTAIALTVHNFPEGLATFTSSLAETAFGLGVAVAVAVHNIPEGFAVAVPIYYATGSRWKGFFLSSLSGFAEPLAGLVGYFVVGESTNPTLFATMFGVISGIMCNLALRELLPSAFKYDPTDRVTSLCMSFAMAAMAATLVTFKIVCCCFTALLNQLRKSVK